MRVNIMVGLLAIVVCLFFVSQGAAFYQWTDENGVVHYGDAPTDDAANVVEKGKSAETPETVTPETAVPSAKPESPNNTAPEGAKTDKVPEKIKEVIDTFTLAPHSKKEISFVSFEPVKIGFKTDVTEERAKQCKNSGAGIKDKYSGKEVLSPYGGKVELKPKNGYIKFYVGNLEDFPINILLFKY